MSTRTVDYALIGGGLASGNCARWLRERGADGSILMIGREVDLPYNRPDCSKGYLQGKQERSKTLFRQPEWFAENDIEVLTRTSATKLDVAARTVTLSTREEVQFGKALQLNPGNADYAKALAVTHQHHVADRHAAGESRSAGMRAGFGYRLHNYVASHYGGSGNGDYDQGARDHINCTVSKREQEGRF